MSHFVAEFGYLMHRADSLAKPLRLGKIEGMKEKRATEDEMVGWHHRLSGHEFEQLWETVKDREAWYPAAHAVEKNWTGLSH